MKDRNGVNVANPKWDRWNRWLVQRKVWDTDLLQRRKSYRWKVTEPFDPVSDYVGTRWFDTYEEALAHANREWLRRKLGLIANELSDDTLDYIAKSLNEVFDAYASIGFPGLKEFINGIV